jgi:transposase
MTDWKAITQKETTEEAVLYLHHLYETGTTSTQLAKMCEVTNETIRNIFRRYDLPIKQHGGLNKGEKKVPYISEEEYRRWTYRQLCKEYGISHATVWKLVKGYKRKRRQR